MFKQTQVRAKNLSKKMNKNLFIIQCHSHVVGYCHGNFFSGIGNFVFNDMNFNYYNNLLRYRNSLLEKIGIMVVFDINQKVFTSKFFLINYKNKIVSHKKF